ncbi:hypothetical protein C0V70_05885 [Bacteriovorax stolpii]|uniref:Uncharacterized protein n=1 Tax=Bacteriovorax stolpii TaxID=960 RepID=A0A2K9NQ63_BACTC|nr:hypothetical protein [Bacteriovorax stolpii]AUN97651.1 hypothetical protein C0V70_05885 [Bacteriovorax stolpii]TDP52833.1 hypothetical protein C8D79_2600 [Bacteriovorax stolpii]
MSFKKTAMAMVFAFISLSIHAHEGHDTGATKSLHGGIVKKSKNAFVEIVQDEKIEIYVTDHNYKNLISPNFIVLAFADVKGKKLPLKLESHGANLSVSTDLKKEKHFKLNIVLKINGQEEQVSFPLEN